MKKNKLANKISIVSTQKYLDIAEIRDDLIILKDGTVRAALMISSVNFALKSEDEQNAIIQAYVSFLNSLEFPLQIMVQSRNLNIDKYLEKLSRLEKEQTNELMRMQIADYRVFLQELLEIGKIMTKKFYVVVPFSGIKKEKRKFWERLLDVFSPATSIVMSKKQFERYREEISKRIDFVANGLSSMGLNIVQLDTQSLIEIFYNIYNFQSAETEKMADVNKLRVEETL
ncbi:hypothetical protein KKF32_02150 [Patescibacteria group bacterium]|nr:hypothetical protein [Patescibacteria group bacterium]